jgi:hypothetical protein
VGCPLRVGGEPVCRPPRSAAGRRGTVRGMSNEAAATLIFAIPSALVVLAAIGLAMTKFSQPRTTDEHEARED